MGRLWKASDALFKLSQSLQIGGRDRSFARIPPNLMKKKQARVRRDQKP